MYECEYCGTMLDAGEKCDCRKEAEVVEVKEVETDELRLEVFPFEPVKEIEFNKSELEEKLTAHLKKYDNLVITKDMVSDIKKEKASLNKLKKALNDEKIRQKKIFTEPITLFEADVKKLISLIENTVKNLDEQITVYDEQERKMKIDKLKRYFDENVGNLKESVTFASIFKERWNNKSESLTACQNDIKSKLFTISKELEVIKEKCVEFRLDCEVKYLENYNLIEALELETELKKRKAAYLKQQAKEEEKERLRTETPTEVSEEIPQATPQEEFFNVIKPAEEKLIKKFKVVFELDETIEALNDLKAYMDSKNLNYRVIK